MAEKQKINTYCIYKHTAPNGKIYIGQTIHGDNPNLRWRSGEGYRRCIHFYNAIQKYGWNNFKHEIIYNNLSEFEANSLEEQTIAENESNNPEYGYNMSTGGGNSRPSAESKAKMRIAKIGKHPSEATRRKLSECKKGNKNCNFGKHLSKETREKIRDANLGKKQSEELIQRRMKNIKKKIICLETNIIYNSAVDASNETGINKVSIGECCRHSNKKRHTAGGYHWEFYKGDE